MLDPNVYLPPGPGQSDARVLIVFLHSLNEPSLLKAAKESSVGSFSVTYFGEPSAEIEVVRLVVNADGSGQISSAVSHGDLEHDVKRAKMPVPAADIQKFLQFVDDVGFLVPGRRREDRANRFNWSQSLCAGRVVVDGGRRA